MSKEAPLSIMAIGKGSYLKRQTGKSQSSQESQPRGSRYPTGEDIKVPQDLISLRSAGPIRTAPTRISCLGFRKQGRMITSFQKMYDSHLVKVGSALQPGEAATEGQWEDPGAPCCGQGITSWEVAITSCILPVTTIYKSSYWKTRTISAFSKTVFKVTQEE